MTDQKIKNIFPSPFRYNSVIVNPKIAPDHLYTKKNDSYFD